MFIDLNKPHPLSMPARIMGTYTFIKDWRRVVFKTNPGDFVDLKEWSDLIDHTNTGRISLIATPEDEFYFRAYFNVKEKHEQAGEPEGHFEDNKDLMRCNLNRGLTRHSTTSPIARARSGISAFLKTWWKKKVSTRFGG